MVFACLIFISLFFPVFTLDNSWAHGTALFKAEFKVEVEVLAPRLMENFPGKQVTFDIRVQNRGTAVDNIRLSVSDDNGWTLALGMNRLEGVPAGENVYTTLTVSIPGFALPFTIDNILIAASSERDPTKVDSDVCQVRVKPLRAVEVEILPNSQSGKPRQVLSYAVKINNRGLLDDLYTLSVEDNGNWGIEISPAQLFLPAGGSGFAALTITVPEWTSGRAEDNVVVGARGMLAKGTRTDPENVSGSGSCIAQAALVRRVDISVLSDEHQTIAPGYQAVWVVSVVNMGNINDVYDLSALEVVRDDASVYENWGVTLDNVSLFVPPGESRITMLRVTAPENVKTRVWNTLTITATSRADPMVTDSDICFAHVLGFEPMTLQTGVKVLVEAEIIAIDVWPPIWDFGVMTEAEVKSTDLDAFVVRNVGNKTVSVAIQGADAVSRSGEPIARWTLSETGEVGVDVYAMWYKTIDWKVLSTSPSLIAESLSPGGQKAFALRIQAPRTITAQARMWTMITLTVIRA
jgi:hypothetical protein